MKYLSLFSKFIIAICLFSYLLFPNITLAQNSSSSLWDRTIGQIDWSYYAGFLATGNPVGGLITQYAGPKLLAIADESFATVINFLASIILWILSLLLSLSNFLFVEIVEYTIIDFSANLEKLGVITDVWTIVRDVANIFFIFILLYLAISTVLQTPGVDTRKMLVNIIIIALVINFSAIFTKIAIDASNVTALTFYNLLVPEGATDNRARIATYYRSALSFFQSYDVNRVLSEGGIDNVEEYGATGISSATIQVIAKNFGMAILLAISIFTLAAASFLLLLRGLSLIILIIISPLAFLGYGFSPLKEIFNKWLDRLKCDVLFAPLFFFMLYLTFSLLNNIYGQNAAAQPNTISGHIIMFFILNGLMLGSIIIAQKVGCDKSGKAFGFVKSSIGKFGISTQTPQKLAGGAAGLIGRNTIGRGARAIQQSDKFKNFVSKAPKTGWLANTAAEKVAGFGFGSSLGYNQRTEQRQKRQAEQLKLIKDPARQAQYLANLQTGTTIGGQTVFASPDDAKKQYGDLSDRNKADIEITAIKNGDAKILDSIRGLRDGLKGEKRDSANKEYEKQLRDFIKVADKDYTDSRGNKVKKGDSLTLTQQQEKMREISQVFAKDKTNPTVEEKEKGLKVLQEIYEALPDADKVTQKEEAKNNITRVTTKEKIRDDAVQQDPNASADQKAESARLKTESITKAEEMLNVLQKFESEYIRGRSETEQKFYEEKEKIDKRATEQALKEARREAKTRIDKIFEGQNMATYKLTDANIQDLKDNMDKLSSKEVSDLDVNILKNAQVQELLSKPDIKEIFANTEKIGRVALSEIKTGILNNEKVEDGVKDAIDPTYSKRKKADQEQQQAQNNPPSNTPPTQPQPTVTPQPDFPPKNPRSRTKYDASGNKTSEDIYNEPIN